MYSMHVGWEKANPSLRDIVLYVATHEPPLLP